MREEKRGEERRE
jgi:hypothetical protein